MSEKKLYTPPTLYRYEQEVDCSGFKKSVVGTHGNDLAPHFGVKCEHITVVDRDRKYVEVSDSFCRLVGYQREELLGKRYDELTAANTNDIPSVYSMFSKLGYMHGLWMLVSREGARILVRYESFLRPDSLIEGHMEVVK